MKQDPTRWADTKIMSEEDKKKLRGELDAKRQAEKSAPCPSTISAASLASNLLKTINNCVCSDNFCTTMTDAIQFYYS